MTKEQIVEMRKFCIDKALQLHPSSYIASMSVGGSTELRSATAEDVLATAKKFEDYLTKTRNND